MKVLLYGLGRSGLAAGRLLHRQGHEPVWYDQHLEGAGVLEARRAGWRWADDPLASGADLCIAAPGVPIDHPDLVRLRAAGTETIGEVEWVARTVDAPILGVTGTAGKGTVTRWTEAMLHAAGIDAVAGGNLDPALSAVAEPGLWLVTELSSFQLERCPTLHPRVAVVTVLGRDHLDRHGDLATYHALKRSLLTHLGPDDTAVLNADDPLQDAWGRDTPARVARYGLTSPTAYARIDVGRVLLGDHDLGPVSALGPPGRHQRSNLLAAAAAAEAAGADPDAIAATIPTLTSAPGRHELVTESCGVRFVDDSIATRELAVAAALEAATPPIAWIVGGRDKGADPDAVRTLVPGRVAQLIGIGEAGPRFVQAFAQEAPGRIVPDADGRAAMAAAVRIGAETVRARGGGTVLLAPLAASFDQFRDHEARGRAFRDAVLALAGEVPWTACS
ncbi:MAG: UDP-N-acetylmuramoyl-L-alanine--D-glutamate ligase [Trueperaceae bacterium]|nr:UDP-N-acetylmuramoyl-L-alanine--D-glutamate ligase [Trueperaceae bacterium]